jgi:hypothetical protein
MYGLLQVAVVLHGLVEIWDGSLENILDDALDDDMLLGRKFRVVEVANSFKDNVLLKLLLVVVLFWVDAYLPVDSSELPFGELGPSPEASVQLTALLAPGPGFSTVKRKRLHAVAETSAFAFLALNLLVDLPESLPLVDVFIGATKLASSESWRGIAIQISLCRLVDLHELLPASKSSSTLAFAFSFA